MESQDASLKRTAEADPAVCVQVGDKVMFREPGGLEARKIKIKEGEFFVLSVNDILAKIPE